MKCDDDLHDTFADICVLFELALSIGQSLDVHDNCERFLTTLMARKDLGFAAVWLYADVLDGSDPSERPDARTLRLLQGIPLVHVRETSVDAMHAAFSSTGSGPVSFSSCEAGRLIEEGITDGTWALFPLGALGFLRLFSSQPSRLADPVELSQLETVVRKFCVSIEGCLAHRRLIAEVARRERVERERERMRQQLEHAHKMEAIGRLAGGVAHDFNNLLAVIAGHAELLSRRAASELGPATALPAVKQDLDAIASASDRAADLTGQLLAFSRRGKLRKTSLRIEDLIDEAIALITRTCDPNVAVSFDRGAPDAWVLGDAALLQSVVINLLVNACDAMPEGGRIEVASTWASRAGAPRSDVRITIRDTGVGMPADVVARAFEPFFTTKAVGRGTGLGLSVAYGTIQSHGGTIAIESSVGEGTTFTIHLPVTQQPEPRAPLGAPAPPEPRGGGEAILVVDDHAEVRDVMARIVRNAGYAPLLAEDGVAALALLEREHAVIRAVLLDVRMPRMDGVETLRRLRQRAPALPVIIVSGFGADRDLDLMRALGVHGEVEKPFSSRELAGAIAQALAAGGTPDKARAP